jgi:hypothetical protein
MNRCGKLRFKLRLSGAGGHSVSESRINTRIKPTIPAQGPKQMDASIPPSLSFWISVVENFS